MNSIATAAVQLKSLDLSVYAEGKGMLPSQFGIVTVRKSISGPGYIAEAERQKSFGLTPSFAYAGLIDLIERDRDFEQIAAATAKDAYFRWRESWSGYEDVTGYILEDQERRAALGITEQDDADRLDRKMLEIDF